MQTIKLRQTTENNGGPCTSKSDAKGSWPSQYVMSCKWERVVMAHVCGAADVENACAEPCLQAEECTRMCCGTLDNGGSWLNHWFHIMDYFTDALTTFLGLGTFHLRAV